MSYVVPIVSAFQLCHYLVWLASWNLIVFCVICFMASSNGDVCLCEGASQLLVQSEGLLPCENNGWYAISGSLSDAHFYRRYRAVDNLWHPFVIAL